MFLKLTDKSDMDEISDTFDQSKSYVPLIVEKKTNKKQNKKQTNKKQPLFDFIISTSLADMVDMDEI